MYGGSVVLVLKVGKNATFPKLGERFCNLDTKVMANFQMRTTIVDPMYHRGSIPMKVRVRELDGVDFPQFGMCLPNALMDSSDLNNQFRIEWVVYTFSHALNLGSQTLYLRRLAQSTQNCL